MGFRELWRIPEGLCDKFQPSPGEPQGKENPDLPLVYSNYWLLIMALSLCFNHLVLSTFRQCKSEFPKRSAKPIASIQHTVEYP